MKTIKIIRHNPRELILSLCQYYGFRPKHLAMLDRLGDLSVRTAREANRLEFNWILSKTKVKWNAKDIENYLEYWATQYHGLSGIESNPAIPWTADLIHKYADYLNWESLSSNTALPWSVDFIRRFLHLLNCKTLAANPLTSSFSWYKLGSIMLMILCLMSVSNLVGDDSAML